jgi:hypothetical protein
VKENGGESGSLGGLSDHDVNLTLSKRERERRLGRSILDCQAI